MKELPHEQFAHHFSSKFNALIVDMIVKLKIVYSLSLSVCDGVSLVRLFAIHAENLNCRPLRFIHFCQ